MNILNTVENFRKKLFKIKTLTELDKENKFDIKNVVIICLTATKRKINTECLYNNLLWFGGPCFMIFFFFLWRKSNHLHILVIFPIEEVNFYRLRKIVSKHYFTCLDFMIAKNIYLFFKIDTAFCHFISINTS